MDVIRIGRFLAELRHERRLTQEALGERLGVTGKTISRWETGMYLPPAEMLLALSEYYGVSVNELLSGRRLEAAELPRAADENLTQVLRDSPFGWREQMTYFQQKWRREHVSSLVLLLAAVIGLLAAGVLWRSSLAVAAALLAAAGQVVRYNRMMAYAEGHVFHVPEAASSRRG